VKQLREETETYQGLAACKLVCDEYSVLWPQPTGTVELGRVLVPFNYDDINIIGVSGKKPLGLHVLSPIKIRVM
jgi:hypothetical protein